MTENRLEEGVGVLRHALSLAVERDLPGVALRARFNLAGISIAIDRWDEALEQVNEGLALARERGDRSWEFGLLSQQASPLTYLGRWDEVLAATAPLLAAPPSLNNVVAAAFVSAIAAARRDDDTAERCRVIPRERRDSVHVDERAGVRLVEAREAAEHGDAAETLALARAVLSEATTAPEVHESAYMLGVQAAQLLEDDAALVELDELVSRLRAVQATPVMRSGQARVRAELAHRRGDDAEAAELQREAITLLRELGARPLVADALVEQARRSDDADAIAEARAIYTDLGATRRLMQIDEPTGLTA